MVALPKATAKSTPSKVRPRTGARAPSSRGAPESGRWRRGVQGRADKEASPVDAVAKKALRGVAVARAGSVTYTILFWATPLYMVQALVAIFGFPGLMAGGIASTWIPFLPDSLNPGYFVFQITHVFAFTLAVIAMVGASVHYAIAGVWDCFSGVRLLLFALAVALSALFPALPWIVVWFIGVVYLAE